MAICTSPFENYIPTQCKSWANKDDVLTLQKYSQGKQACNQSYEMVEKLQHMC